MKILYITHELPLPTRTGHQKRVIEVVEALSSFATVHCVGYVEDEAIRVTFGRSTFEGVPGPIRIRRKPALLGRAVIRSLFLRTPYSIAKFDLGAMRRTVELKCEEFCPDVILTGLFTSLAVPAGPWKVIHDSHNVEHHLWQSIAAARNWPISMFARRESRLLRKLETHVWKSSDAIISIADEDVAVIRDLSPRPVICLPVQIAEPPLRTSQAKWDIGLIGVWSWEPNAAALRFFCKKVLPKLLQKGLSVRIAGPNLRPELASELTRLGVECSGFVFDLSEFYSSIRFLVAPYWIGGGVRMKVAEALSYGCPVFGTSLAFRGIRREVPASWVEDDPSEFADALVERCQRVSCPILPKCGGHSGRQDPDTLAREFFEDLTTGASSNEPIRLPGSARLTD